MIYEVGWSKNATITPTSDDNANPLLVLGTVANSINNVTISGNRIYNCITGYSECLTINGNVENFIVAENKIYFAY